MPIGRVVQAMGLSEFSNMKKMKAVGTDGLCFEFLTAVRRCEEGREDAKQLIRLCCFTIPCRRTQEV